MGVGSGSWGRAGVGVRDGGEGAREPPGHSPSTSRSLRASTPGDRMKSSGVAGLLSSNALLRSNLVLSTYFAPSFSSTKFLFKKRTCKSRTEPNHSNPLPTEADKNLHGLFQLGKCHSLGKLHSRHKKETKHICGRAVFLGRPQESD